MGFQVGDNYRTNELSLRPGGYIIVVEHTNGAVYEYDKIKKPHAYIRAIARKENVSGAWIKGTKPDKPGNTVATL